MTGTAAPMTDRNHTDCPINLLRGYHRVRARHERGDIFSIIVIAFLFVALLAGPAAMLASSAKSDAEKTIAGAQALICEHNAAACGAPVSARTN